MSDPVQIYKSSDENQQTVTLTPAALDHVKASIKKRGSGLGMRVSLNRTGCSGLAYEVQFVDEAQAGDKVFKADDEVHVFVSLKDFPTLQGTQIDYVKEALGKRFIFHNPNATGSCGCGESFTVS